ncbi:histidine triad (HIT) family protein [Pullulanibacillus pueri]|uniref:Protein hit n=1 Tax=Pullulanibacillus pueri TaxID=1437324 RepID=A0A8J3ENP8_9BACL|nr:HIT family protein [Pullulanibacillus pueri]MBM7683431.1 histidine triad (HIT) family protein [Pullulanibacillus pueri]GGH87379.1 protein hit [Pullulanibacillus pueri]
MAHDQNCIFCKIINGEVPSAKVFENDDVYAFLDLSQVTKGHTLVIPKDHQANIFELQEETAAKLFSVVPKIARAVRDAFQPLGLNLMNNNGKEAEQTVFHYHVHIIPRYGKEDGYKPIWHPHQEDYTPEDLQKIAASIAQEI